MTNKFRKTIYTIILLILVITIFTACSKINSKIVGTWENVDKKITAVQTFTSNGHYTLESPISTKTYSGEYTIKGDSLQIDVLNEQGKKIFDNKYKIIELADDFMTLELQDGTRMSYRKQKINANQ